MDSRFLFTAAPLLKACSMIHAMPSPDEIQNAYGRCPEPVQTALMFHAAWHDDARALRRAIERGASVEALEPGRSSLTQVCALRGSQELFRAALDAGAPLASPEDSDRPSIFAALARRCVAEAPSAGSEPVEDMRVLAMAKLAYDRGARFNTETSHHWLSHPLTLAASKDALEMARFLLARGALADRVFSDGVTPLLVACEHKSERVAHLLLDWSELALSPESRVDAARKERTGPRRGALHLAAHSGCSAELIERLALAGAVVDERDALSMTPLHLAANSGRLDLIASLARLGADLDAAAVSDHGWRPLFFAIDNGQAAACSLLLELGADPEALDGNGRSARQSALEANEPETLSAFAAFDASRQRAQMESLLPPVSVARRPLSL